MADPSGLPYAGGTKGADPFEIPDGGAAPAPQCWLVGSALAWSLMPYGLTPALHGVDGMDSSLEFLTTEFPLSGT